MQFILYRVTVFEIQTTIDQRAHQQHRHGVTIVFINRSTVTHFLKFERILSAPTTSARRQDCIYKGIHNIGMARRTERDKREWNEQLQTCRHKVIQSCNHVYTWLVTWSKVTFVWSEVTSIMERTDSWLERPNTVAHTRNFLAVFCFKFYRCLELDVLKISRGR